MKNKLPKILFLALMGVLAITWLHARSQPGQTSNTATTPLNLQEHLTKHSARPPVAEFGEVSNESPEAHQRRQIREGLVKGLYRRTIGDPGTKEVNGQAETLNLTFIDGVTILKPGERPDPLDFLSHVRPSLLVPSLTGKRLLAKTAPSSTLIIKHRSTKF
jgi:hypothetical protein